MNRVFPVRDKPGEFKMDRRFRVVVLGEPSAQRKQYEERIAFGQRAIYERDRTWATRIDAQWRTVMVEAIAPLPAPPNEAELLARFLRMSPEERVVEIRRLREEKRHENPMAFQGDRVRRDPMRVLQEWWRREQATWFHETRTGAARELQRREEEAREKARRRDELRMFEEMVIDGDLDEDDD